MSKYSTESLLELMAMLRNPELGCNWDLKQTLQSLTTHTLEEVYEVMDAVERKDCQQLCDELGDVLFQVVFYSQIAAEAGEFCFADVVQSITEKLLRRHPHVFPDGTLASFGSMARAGISAEQVAVNWELIKNEERRRKAVSRDDERGASLLDDVPGSLPAIVRAEKLQKRAASAGFDWENHQGVLVKLKEEIGELDAELTKECRERIFEEFGDILFTCVNLARHLNIDAEASLRASNRKFENRFRVLERISAADGGTLADLTQSEMDALWENIKRGINP